MVAGVVDGPVDDVAAAALADRSAEAEEAEHGDHGEEQEQSEAGDEQQYNREDP